MKETKSHTGITKRILTLLALLTAALGLGFQTAQAEAGEFVDVGSVGWVYDCGDCWAFSYALKQYVYIPGLEIPKVPGQPQPEEGCCWVFMTDYEEALPPEQVFYQCSDCVGYFTRIKELDKWVYIPGIDMIDQYGWIYVME